MTPRMDAARVQLNAVPGVLVVHDGPGLAGSAGQPAARVPRGTSGRASLMRGRFGLTCQAVVCSASGRRAPTGPGGRLKCFRRRRAPARRRRTDAGAFLRETATGRDR